MGLLSRSRQSSPGGSPFLSHAKWADQSLQLPTSLPIRQNLRSTSRKGLIFLFLAVVGCIALFTRTVPKRATSDIYNQFRQQISTLQHHGPIAPSFKGTCRLDLTTLDSYNLTSEITYARRYIQRRPFSKGKDPRANLAWVDNLDQNMFRGLDYVQTSGFQSTQRADQIVELPNCSPDPMPLYLRQQHNPVDASQLAFGVASTAGRLLESADTMALWLANTGATLFAIVPTGPRVHELKLRYEAVGINAVILTSNEKFLVNYFKLIEAFFKHAGPRFQWYTFIDDDTHYFSLQRFVNILHSYDSNKEIYLGAVSEDLRQIRMDGLYAFGGAGITVSKVLMEQLHWNYYGCLAGQGLWEPGDVRLKRCIYQHTETKMTMVEGLHQVDLLGDTSGILEGPRPPISWHHYRSWSFQNVSLISRAGEVCGGACLFQRWRFPVSSEFGYTDMSFHFGVSIVGYSIGIVPDLGRTETTWNPMWDSNFDHSLAPLREGLMEGRDRFTYRLLGVGTDIDGHVKHTYVKYADREQQREKEVVAAKAEESETKFTQKVIEMEKERVKEKDKKKAEEDATQKATEKANEKNKTSEKATDKLTKEAATEETVDETTKDGSQVEETEKTIESESESKSESESESELRWKRSLDSSIDEVMELIFI